MKKIRNKVLIDRIWISLFFSTSFLYNVLEQKPVSHLIISFLPILIAFLWPVIFNYKYLLQASLLNDHTLQVRYMDSWFREQTKEVMLSQVTHTEWKKMEILKRINDEWILHTDNQKETYRILEKDIPYYLHNSSMKLA